MTVSLLAIASIMVVGWAFGIVCDRLLIRWSKSHLDTSEDGTEDHDRWENDPEPTNTCDTCRWDKITVWDAECYHCNDYDKWEEKD